jgi:hypothetical protein
MLKLAPSTVPYIWKFLCVFNWFAPDLSHALSKQARSPLRGPEKMTLAAQQWRLLSSGRHLPARARLREAKRPQQTRTALNALKVDGSEICHTCHKVDPLDGFWSILLFVRTFYGSSGEYGA